MEDKHDGVEDVEAASSDSFIDDSDDDGPSTSGRDDELQSEAPLNEEEIEDLIAELLEVESKAAEAQESLEEESLTKLEDEVREELLQTLRGDDLETAVAEEMETFKEDCEAVLDELETESAYLLEQLDGAGIELPSLYKWIESQAPNGCNTEAWRKRTQWVGSQATTDYTDSIANAEKYLQTHRPVRRRHGKLLEEGASGFLAGKLATAGNSEAKPENSEVDWCSFNKIISDGLSEDSTSVSSKQWASVYFASTPQQAAELGLQFSGVDEVEEIDDVDGDCVDPLVAAAIANERELDISEAQRRKFRKVREEDDAKSQLKLQLQLKQKRRRRGSRKGPVENVLSGFDSSNSSEKGDLVQKDNPEAARSLVRNGSIDNVGGLYDVDEEETVSNGCADVKTESDLGEPKGLKRWHGNEDVGVCNKKFRTCNNGDEAIDVTEVEDHDSRQADQPPPSTDNLPSGILNEHLYCTACNMVVSEVHKHPIMNVVVCKGCKSLIEIKMHMKDSECFESYCAWCGRTSDLISCRSCNTLFCRSCILRNIGEDCLLGAKNGTWQCCCCSPSLLEHLRLNLEKAGPPEILDVSSSDNDSDSDSSSSSAQINVPVSFKRISKKKIRRILDDTELGEETKRKIAVEKERQERLKSLQVQFSSKAKVKSSANCNWNSLEGAGIEVLGDGSTGYVVNVVREKGEEPVRIPQSISTKLKGHQVAGIRFLWENIIQSVRKVKSGDKGLGCILAHTMGLGKTFQVIAFLYTAMRCVDLGLNTALIVTPVNVLHNWKQEFFKWRPLELKPLRVFMLEDVSRERRPELLGKWKAKGGVLLIGYAAFRNLSLGKHAKDHHLAREICNALQEVPDILVCDEAHMIKNTKAYTTQALKQVRCQRRIALTGSPLQNNLMEYYCMVDFVREGFLGSSHEFRNRFQNPIENGQHTNSTSEDVKIMNQRSHILYEQLKGFVQRMGMNVVKKDLPPKTVFVITVKLSPLQRKLYKKFLDVHGFTSDKVSNEKIRTRGFLAGYQALAQIWNHPGILQLTKDDRDLVTREGLENFTVDDSSSDENLECGAVLGDKTKKNELLQRRRDDNFFHEDWWHDLLHKDNYKDAEYSGKMVLLLDILRMCSDAGDKALIFSQSIPTLDLIEMYLSKLARHGKQGKYWRKGKDWYRIDGRTQGSERQKLVEMFNEPSNRRVKCTLISTKAGSLGINLYAANRVIIVDGSWNPTYDLQAIYRAWRYGQKKPVFAYRLLAHGTMEEKIYKRQVTKEGLAARVVDRQQVYRTMSKEEILHLFDFGEEETPDTLAEREKTNEHMTNAAINFQKDNLMRQKMNSLQGSCSSDKLMESLLSRHHSRWIANYHEHETLLQENEEEKLSKEEQDMAWEVYQKTFEWEEVQRVPLSNSKLEQTSTASKIDPSASETRTHAASKRDPRNYPPHRKCTNLSHLLTLRSQGTKAGCSTVCGECAQVINWDLNRDEKPAR